MACVEDDIAQEVVVAIFGYQKLEIGVVEVAFLGVGGPMLAATFENPLAGSVWHGGDKGREALLGEGFENFAILTATVKRMDWLYLSFRGNRRAIFDWSRTGGEDGKWLVP